MFNEYLISIEVLEAEKTLTDVNVSSFPHIKQNEQKKMTRELKKVHKRRVKKSGASKPKFAEVLKRLTGKSDG